MRGSGRKSSSSKGRGKASGGGDHKRKNVRASSKSGKASTPKRKSGPATTTKATSGVFRSATAVRVSVQAEVPHSNVRDKNTQRTAASSGGRVIPFHVGGTAQDRTRVFRKEWRAATERAAEHATGSIPAIKSARARHRKVVEAVQAVRAERSSGRKNVKP